MSTGYKFIYDREPTDEELQVIMSEATISVIQKAEEAKQEYARKFNEYLAELNIKYVNISSTDGYVA
jgi:hypothetical protein